ncbi:MAG: bifunctional 4-hydroxy-2-oxoglutarate aldolase/2-dehydro-3-deoxy-phosphogluconate aldolase [Bacillota bacterium]|nr:bifunctional 4-hydroxy-2-oxoglutarate aldolase/2-dehydro-3-deoxy-phosphogluconate aldolase [Bacillota bacterium]
MNKLNDPLTEMIRRHRVIAIMRHLPDEQVEPVFSALADAGIRLIEITMNTSGAAEQISRVIGQFSDRMMIGAGTVSTPGRARIALSAGAQFLVTPNLDLEVIAMAKEHHCPIMPGVLTPTEMMAAIKAGVVTLKLFPASQLGPAYVKDVLAPLDDLNLVAVGGVTQDNAAEWINAGCIGVGMGSSLLDKDLMRVRNYAEIVRRTKIFIDSLYSTD